MSLAHDVFTIGAVGMLPSLPHIAVDQTWQRRGRDRRTILITHAPEAGSDLWSVMVVSDSAFALHDMESTRDLLASYVLLPGAM